MSPAGKLGDSYFEWDEGGGNMRRIPDLGWWSISGEELLKLLRRVASGESPDLVYAEAYANSEHEQIDGAA